MKSGPVSMPSGPVRQSDPAMSASSSGQFAAAPRAGSPRDKESDSGRGWPRAQSPAVQARASSVQSLPVGEAVAAPMPMAVKRSGMAVFGWIMLVLILLGGAGALAYFFLIQNADRAGTVPAAMGTASGSTAPMIEQGSNVVPPNGSGSQDTAKTGSDDSNDDSGSGTGSGSAKRPKNPATNPTPKHPPVAAATNLADLKKQAIDLEKDQDWANARVIWEKLEKNKQYAQFAGYAVYKQAWAAFQSGDTTSALSLAQKAATMKGNQVIDAHDLVGDALFKQGEYERAKTFYIEVRGKVTGAKKTQVTNKIMAANKKLGKPERDGIVGP